MLRFSALLLFIILPFLSHADELSYQLGAGDVISISVYDEPDLSIEQVSIGLSGSISFPLLGQIQVSGLSPEQLQDELLKGLKGPYLIDPSITVSIVEYRPFYISGEVEKPGSYPFHPGLTIDKAVSISGGFTERASKGSIYVTHDNPAGLAESDDAEPKLNNVKLFDVVRPGDVITVEQSFF